MKSLSEFDDLLKTLVIRAPLETQGWDSVIHNLEIASGPQVFLYVHDLATQWTWMAGVGRDDFCKAAKLGGKLKPKRVSDVRGAVLSAVIELAGKAGNTEAEQALGLALSLYAGGTQTFQAAGGFKEGGHFCVILYRENAEAQEASLRPFTFPGSLGKPIAADAFMGAVQQVVQIDRARHPEWFGSRAGK